MRYLGGKTRIAKWVADVVRSHSRGRRTRYVEPFVGSLATFVEQAGHFDTLSGYDAHEDLVLAWNAVMRGDSFPAKITRQDYDNLRTCAPSPLRGVVGFGSSFGGKWFGGFVDFDKRGDPERTYLKVFLESMERRARTIREAEGSCVIECRDYTGVSIGERDVVYCDPPYRGKTGYASTRFNSDEFWRTTRAWAETGAVVLVSEEDAPPFAKLVAELRRVHNIRSASRTHRPERIFEVTA